MIEISRASFDKLRYSAMYLQEILEIRPPKKVLLFTVTYRNTLGGQPIMTEAEIVWVSDTSIQIEELCGRIEPAGYKSRSRFIYYNSLLNYSYTWFCKRIGSK